MRYADSSCTVTEVYDEISREHSYIYTGVCLVTGQTYSVKVPAIGLFNYRGGMNIQDAMPSVSPEDREFLISGFSPNGWAMAFPPEDEMDDDAMLSEEGDEDDSSIQF